MKSMRNFYAICLMFTLLLGVNLGSGSEARAQVAPAVADLNDDGVVNILDYSLLGSRFGLSAGQDGFLDGLDLVPNSEIDMADIMAMIGNFGQTGAPTDPTVFHGRIYDGVGNPMEGVTVRVGAVEDMTDQTGEYRLIGPPTGATFVTFDGSTAMDPTPGGSGQYPTIPNKPVFINGGVNDVNQFRDMSLPERDLTGAVMLDAGNANITVNGDGTTTAVLTQDVEVNNVGVMLNIPAGCTATFPNGEVAQVSLTRVDPAFIPVNMPPGLNSTLFVTYQPGGTMVDCPAATPMFTEFENVDGFDLSDTPILNGVQNGNFARQADCIIVDVDGNGVDGDVNDNVRCGPLDPNFEFAWYHTDIITPTPCPQTTVVGRVLLNNLLMDPVAGAGVSVPGVGPVSTRADGSFTVFRVPAGPNGRFCRTRSFRIRASASARLAGISETGVSPTTPAVPGGITNLGDIKLRVPGTVTGSVVKLSRIRPLKIDPLPGAVVTLDDGFAFHSASANAGGSYFIPNVAVGPYQKDATFSGFVTLPNKIDEDPLDGVDNDGDGLVDEDPVDGIDNDGDGIMFKELFQEQIGTILFDGHIDVNNFFFTSTGTVKVTVVDDTGLPVPGVNVDLNGLGGNFGGLFVVDPSNQNQNTNAGGMVTFDGVPMGSCEVDVLDTFTGALLGSDDCFVNVHNEFIEIQIVVVPPPPRPVAVVGYYELGRNRGVTQQIKPIQDAGHIPRDVGNLNTANLNEFDMLFVQNPSNGGFSSIWLSNLSRVDAWVRNGGVLIFHDRRVAGANVSIPGASGMTILRNFGDARRIDIVDNTTAVTNGPGGVLNNTSLDGGNSSSHGFARSTTLPPGGRNVLSRNNPAEMVTFSYPLGLGDVIYSTIPLDFYLARSGPTAVSSRFRNIYAPNVIEYGNQLR